MPTRRELDPQIQTVFFPEDGQENQGVNQPGTLSRWFIKDLEYHDLVNLIPLEEQLQQTLGPTLIGTFASPPLWISAQTLNKATFIFALCANGHIYQMSLGGVSTDISGGSPTFSVNTDIANWQGTTIIISDLNASNVYSWNGTTFATVFGSQPEQFITTFAGRLWMANQNVITFTASNTFNSLMGDSGSFAITDSDCPPPVRCLNSFGGNLYVMGYNFVKIYGGLYDAGSPAVLQFSQSTLTDEAGIYTKWGFLPFGYQVMYPSLMGVWNLLGSQPVFISEKVGGYFQSMTVANSSLSAAFGYVLGIPCFMWNLYYSADSLFPYRILCLTYTGQGQGKWFTVSQGNINFITYGVNQATGQQLVWGSDTSNNLYTLFTNAAPITSKVSTRLWTFGSRIRQKTIGRVGVETVASSGVTLSLIASDESLNTATPDLQSLNPTTTLTWTNGAQVFSWDNAQAFSWIASTTVYELVEFNFPITVRKLGLDLTLVGSGTVIGSFAVEFEELPADWGSSGI